MNKGFLACFRRLPIDKLKVDQSFVRNLERDPGETLSSLGRTGVAHGSCRHGDAQAGSQRGGG
ncbi:MAG: hypothetical protein Q8O33_00960 [Pseudomonadota bacterium]|nr:hypothetical protein [Pseudomonadota bacterium]